MLFHSSHLRITADSGTATLWLGFPGEPANAFDVSRLRELEAALASIEAHRSVRILVIRSANVAGFSEGLHPQAISGLTHPADRAAFAWYGQRVFERLAGLEAATVAFIEGRCLGAGLELALACDYRLCASLPTTLLGFPDCTTSFGGTPRLRELLGRKADSLVISGKTLSGREAQAMGLVDVAFCERRARIELRTFLDRLELRPLKPRVPVELVGLAEERRKFAVDGAKPAKAARQQATLNPIPPLPRTVGLLGDDVDAATLAAEVAVRGGELVVCGNRALVYAGIEAARSRGFITPLEAERARLRVRHSEDLGDFRRAGLVFVARGQNPFRLARTVLPRAIVGVVRSSSQDAAEALPSGSAMQPNPMEVFPYPRRVVGVSFLARGRVALFSSIASDTDATATLAAWLRPLGRESLVSPSLLHSGQHRADAAPSHGESRGNMPHFHAESTASNASSVGWTFRK